MGPILLEISRRLTWYPRKNAYLASSIFCGSSKLFLLQTKYLSKGSSMILPPLCRFVKWL